MWTPGEAILKSPDLFTALEKEAMAFAESRQTTGLGRLCGAEAGREPAHGALSTQSGLGVPLVIVFLCPREETSPSCLLWEPVGGGGVGGIWHRALTPVLSRKTAAV